MLFFVALYFPSNLQEPSSEIEEKRFAEKMGISEEYLYTFYKVAEKADVLRLDVRLLIERINIIRTLNTSKLDNLERVKKIQDTGV